jgi:tetratricopeptide (TPR) repeat protein
MIESNLKKRVSTRSEGLRRSRSLLLFLCAALLIFGCKKEDRYLTGLKKYEETGYKGREISKERIEQMRNSIEKFHEKVEKTVENTRELGDYYKMLALEFMNEQMYGPATEYYKEALYYYPDNPVLLYETGVATARLAKVQGEEEGRIDLLRQAAEYYQRSIELDTNYTEPMYALSVLYVFEFETPLRAEEYLRKIVDIEKQNYEAMFLLARVYVLKGEVEAAVSLYDRIIQNTDDPEEKSNAKRNKERLLQGAY